jgi:D-beta-D-heptose 7-phosphate kinase/D-beta-D-heptose 1-phosphate adenosyltransferase
MHDAASLIDRFGTLRALVIGDAMLDSYLSGPSRRLCQEAPVPIVDVTDRVDVPGGAANCAVNLARLGAHVELIGVTGQDCEGELLRERLVDAGVSTRRLIASDQRRTLSKCRIACDNHLVVRFDQGSTETVDEELDAVLAKELREAYRLADVIIVSDYGYGTLTPKTISTLTRLQHMLPRVVAVDAKNLIAYQQVGITLCKPNYMEAMRLLGRSIEAPSKRRWESLAGDGPSILKSTGARIVAVTLDREGALVFEEHHDPYRTFARSAPQKHAAGAGDTFLSAFALALAAGGATPVAAELASTAASIVVGKDHTAACSATELKHHLTDDSCQRCDAASVLPALAEHRRHKRQIVLTNGCFDILHRGHITYLEQARRLGDVLVVGVNSDESIRRLKGPGRPINSLHDRMRVLAALSCIDHVVSFDEDTPHRLVEAVRPDVFVKGGDYTRQTLPEAELVERLGGTVKILPFVDDRSTTGIITRICRAYGEPSAPQEFDPQGDGDEPTLAIGPAPVVRSA